MRRTIVCVIALVVAAAFAVAADRLVLISTVYSPGQNATIYSYLLRTDDSVHVTPGTRLALTGLAPVAYVGDPVYWHTHEVARGDDGWQVQWQCDRAPRAGVRIFATFDLVVPGRAGVDFEEDYVRWTLDDGGTSSEGRTTGPVPLANGSIAGTVFYDADQDGVHDPGELLLPGVPIALYDAHGSQLAETRTDRGGAFRFDDLVPGTYLVKMLLPDGWARYIVVTTRNADGETVDVEPDDTAHVEFGLYINTSLIAPDVADGRITGHGKSPGYWRHQVELTIWWLTTSRRRDPSSRPRPSEDVLNILAQVEHIWLYTPFQFTDGPNGEPVGLQGLIEADQILSADRALCEGRDPGRPVRICWLAQLARQLLAAEMNWVSGRRSSLDELQWWLLWYAEWAYNNPAAARATDAGRSLPAALAALNSLDGD